MLFRSSETFDLFVPNSDEEPEEPVEEAPVCTRSVLEESETQVNDPGIPRGKSKSGAEDIKYFFLPDPGGKTKSCRVCKYVVFPHPTS